MKKKVELKLWIDREEAESIERGKDLDVLTLSAHKKDSLQCSVIFEVEKPEPVLTITPRKLEEMLVHAGYTLFDANKAMYRFFPEYTGDQDDYR